MIVFQEEMLKAKCIHFSERVFLMVIGLAYLVDSLLLLQTDEVSDLS